MNHQRYNDYYLVNDEDMGEDTDSIEFMPRQKCCTLKKCLIISAISFVSLAVLAFIVVFVIFPLVFQNSLSLQQDLVFTRWGLETNSTVFQILRFPEYKNYYVPVKDLATNETLKLGLWHILPFDLAKAAIYNDTYDYEDALKNSNYSVLLYFHGTGEDRSDNLRKYQFFRTFFHVIVFDYRGYGDSQAGTMLEKNIVNDCRQIYQWLQEKTSALLFVWGHSLGTSLAVSTLSQLGQEANTTGLILEAAFTSFAEELYHHPYVKYFRWLPWFKQTIVNPLRKNGFLFETSKHILNVTCPILFLHAIDDAVVPYFMSKQLYNISMQRNVDEEVKNNTQLVLFDKRLNLRHYFIYQDSYTIFYFYNFMRHFTGFPVSTNESSHQS
ncbi:unnamed protein product [Ceutorhynchus assimilis]|uniref:Serine aminopeptidase S33 domain-containing protein n=1 Tax=Ceutorhynchus assimilis TaxID=467358 RepID=A0A9N9QEW9_9CUCU|nr:unnamed protein product [Ceutorhynchus assimilis]